MISQQPDSRRELYLRGDSDAQIGRALGVNRYSIRDWRRRHGLPSNVLAPLADPTYQSRCQERLRRWELGETDAKIADAEGCDPTTVSHWRRSKGLALNYDRRAPSLPVARECARRALLSDCETDRTIAAAEGRSISAIQFWRKIRGLSANKPVRQAQDRNYYRKRAVVVSLDAPGIFGGTLHDRACDPRWSNWLEEMGATVW